MKINVRSQSSKQTALDCKDKRKRLPAFRCIVLEYMLRCSLTDNEMSLSQYTHIWDVAQHMRLSLIGGSGSRLSTTNYTNQLGDLHCGAECMKICCDGSGYESPYEMMGLLEATTKIFSSLSHFISSANGALTLA